MVSLSQKEQRLRELLQLLLDQQPQPQQPPAIPDPEVLKELKSALRAFVAAQNWKEYPFTRQIAEATNRTDPQKFFTAVALLHKRILDQQESLAGWEALDLDDIAMDVNGGGAFVFGDGDNDDHGGGGDMPLVFNASDSQSQQQLLVLPHSEVPAAQAAQAAPAGPPPPPLLPSIEGLPAPTSTYAPPPLPGTEGLVEGEHGIYLGPQPLVVGDGGDGDAWRGYGFAFFTANQVRGVYLANGAKVWNVPLAGVSHETQAALADLKLEDDKTLSIQTPADREMARETMLAVMANA